LFLDDPAYATGVGLLLWGERHGGVSQAQDNTVEGALGRFFLGLRRLWFRWMRR